MPPHRLDPLLRPRSLAIVGASARAGSVGRTLVRHARMGGYGGALYLINPRYGEVEGVACYPSFAALPGPVEHAVFALGDERIEEEVARALAHGIKAATIIAPLALDSDGGPPLKERIRGRAAAAGVALCGGNSMGLYNFTAGLWAGGFETRPSHRPGGVVLLTQAGALFAALVDCEERIDYALAVSTGQELTTTMSDYMDYALEQPETRVIGLFLETARDPKGFERTLAKAQRRGVPVVALKVGRTEESARLALSHSGALAGHDGAYQALFERYHVARVQSIDELAIALIVFSGARDIGPGGLATTHDSGGERELILDLGHDLGTRFARLSPLTVERLRAVLDVGLLPVNPLDHWSTARKYPADCIESFKALMTDPDTAMGALVLDRTPGGKIMPHYLDLAHAALKESGKPTFIVSNHQGSGTDPEAVASTRAGVPVLDGVPAFLKATRLLFEWRDSRARPEARPVAGDPAPSQRWRARLADAADLDEVAGLRLLADFGVPTVACEVATSLEAALNAARRIGFPVALKTAMPGLAHKSEVGGVRLDLRTGADLESAYRRMAERLGPRVVVARMVQGPAVEMILGHTRDPDFGPVDLIGFGGVYAEVLRDVVFAKPPFDAAEARRLVDRLRLRPLLDGVRGAPAADLAAFTEAAAAFSVLSASLGPHLDSLDANPVLVLPAGCCAVDALVVPARKRRAPA